MRSPNHLPPVRYQNIDLSSLVKFPGEAFPEEVACAVSKARSIESPGGVKRQAFLIGATPGRARKGG